jgi:hypothetical protein
MSAAREVPDLQDPLDHEVVSSALPAATSVGAVVAKPRRGSLASKRPTAYSFIGGSLIGIAIALPVLTVDALEGDSALLFIGSVTLAATGIGMHLRGASKTGKPTNRSLVPAKGRRPSS